MFIPIITVLKLMILHITIVECADIRLKVLEDVTPRFRVNKPPGDYTGQLYSLPCFIALHLANYEAIRAKEVFATS